VLDVHVCSVTIQTPTAGSAFDRVRKIRLVATIGIEYSTKKIHTALHYVQHRAFEDVQFHFADFGKGNIQGRTPTAIEIGSAFLCGSCPECRRRILLQGQRK